MAWSLPEGCVLGIFGELPDVDSSGAPAELRSAMLFDLLDLWDSPALLAPGGRRVLVFAPADAGPWFDPRVPSSFALQPQAEGDPGERLSAFLSGELEDGASRVVLIGADTPTLDPTFVVSAFVALEGRDVVLGPDSDGGYYLVGCRRTVPPIFDRIDWGTPDVLSQTIDRLDGTGLSVGVLPPWYKVATETSVRMLRGHLHAARRAGMDPLLPRTERWLEQRRS